MFQSFLVTMKLTLFLLISAVSLVNAGLSFLGHIGGGTVLKQDLVILDELALQMRSVDERLLRINALDQQLKLNLKRSSGVVPENLQVLVYRDNERIEDWTHRGSSKQTLYSDIPNHASVLIDERGDSPSMMGKLGPNMLIAPFEWTNQQNSDLLKRELPGLHLVYATKRQDDGQPASDEVRDADTSDLKVVRSVPNQIYVPIHVVVDFGLWKKLARSESEVVTYVKIFYNAVNDLYSQISSPSVSISLQGITICASSSACPKINQDFVSTNVVDAHNSLDKIAEFAYEKKPVTGTEFALMMVMTDYKLCSPKSSGPCDQGTVGLATLSGACDGFDDQTKKTSRVGVAEDHGAFDGVNTVAHEIGHLLGMEHDGDKSDVPGSPGAESCKQAELNIMTSVGDGTKNDPRNWKWSTCSVAQLRWFSTSGRAACLLNIPSTAPYPLENRLPGNMINRDTQCKMLFPTSTGTCDEQIPTAGGNDFCLTLSCSSSSDMCQQTSSVAEGTTCGAQKMCRNGACICEPSANTGCQASRTMGNEQEQALDEKRKRKFDQLALLLKLLS